VAVEQVPRSGERTDQLKLNHRRGLSVVAGLPERTVLAEGTCQDEPQTAGRHRQPRKSNICHKLETGL
jgi:hypothetical protein